MNWIAKQDARHRIVISLVLATLVWFALSRHLQSSTRCIITWDSFAIAVLLLAWLTIVTTPPDKLRARAQKQDLSHILIFIFVLVTACAGLFSVGFLFFSKQAFVEQSHFLIHLLGSLVAVVCSWMLVTDWKRLTATPTTSETSRMGLTTSSAVVISQIRSRTWSLR